MAEKRENIYRRKDGRWEGRYPKCRVDGKIQYGYVYAKTLDDLKEKLLRATASGEGGSDAKFGFPETGREGSFGEIAGQWLAVTEPQLKESSIVRYRNILNLYLLPDFGAKQISDITRSEIVAFSGRLLHSGGKKREGLSSKMVSDILSVQKSVFEYAARMKCCPVEDIGKISVRQPQKPMRILSRSEQERLSGYLCGNLSLCNLGILICLYMGLRIGEICALRWGDVSMEEQCIHVHKTMQRIQRQGLGGVKTEVVVSNPKSDCSIRRIPIPGEALPFIRNAKRSENTYFLTGMENRYIEPRTMQNRFKAVTKICGIDGANFHVLRHTFATRCIELGFDPKSLSEILGHASVSITLNRYVHPSMNLKQKNMDMLSELIAVK